MKLSKALTAAVLSAALCLQTLIPVQALDVQEQDAQTASVGQAIEEPEWLRDYAHKDDDPEYLKFLNEYNSIQDPQAPMVLASDGTSSTTVFPGSASLVHDSRYASLAKSYGVDVSYFQYNIDWKKARAAGVDFAIVRLGYRGYGKAGTLVLDDYFKKNIEGAKAAGIKVGVYFFTQAITEAEVKQEAEFCLKYLKGYSLDLPVYFDTESIDYDVGRHDSANISKATRTKFCRLFCDTIIAAGYQSGIYANQSWMTYQIDGVGLGKEYPMWLARYGTKPADYYGNYYPGDYDIWQYTGSGTLSGFATAVDLNVKYGGSFAPTAAPKVTANGTSLTWTAVSGCDGYVVYSRDSAGKDTALKTVTALSYTVPDTAGLSYYVKAFNKTGGIVCYGPASNLVVAQLPKVTGVTLMGASTNSAAMYWSSVTGASCYEIYSVENGQDVLLDTSNAAMKIMYGLKSNTEYTLKVRAINASGLQGAFSDPVVFRTDRLPVQAGDVNYDDKVDPADYTLLKAYLSGVVVDLSAKGLQAADMDADGKITTSDSTLLQSCIQGTTVM